MAKPHPRRVLHLVALAILAFGLGAAACIYLLTDDSDDTAGGQVVILSGGSTYSIPANATKLYVRDLQRFGGKAALVFDDLNRWFAGLWHGRALASTILWISIAVSLAVFLVARYLFPDEPVRPDR
ncbi:MAG TPA: hypothetical protein VL180_15355 [Burkholderiales bacterium]|jgi:hypothetical protein|nr:hypothetical protein [Burkholderiales bacterium]